MKSRHSLLPVYRVQSTANTLCLFCNHRRLHSAGAMMGPYQRVPLTTAQIADKRCLLTYSFLIANRAASLRSSS